MRERLLHNFGRRHLRMLHQGARSTLRGRTAKLLYVRGNPTIKRKVLARFFANDRGVFSNAHDIKQGMDHAIRATNHDLLASLIDLD